MPSSNIENRRCAVESCASSSTGYVRSGTSALPVADERDGRGRAFVRGKVESGWNLRPSPNLVVTNYI